jgi:hypothetical protein
MKDRVDHFAAEGMASNVSTLVPRRKTEYCARTVAQALHITMAASHRSLFWVDRSLNRSRNTFIAETNSFIYRL